MQNPKFKKPWTVIIALICCVVLSIPVSTAYSFQKQSRIIQQHGITQQGEEYWALIFAVGYYNGAPDQDRPSMIEAANNLHNALLSSPEWQADHIHKITTSQATGRNLLKELIWLIQSSDADDKVVIYLTTHGAPLYDRNGLPLDLPPRDETDGKDEYLVMYDGFINDYAVFWDDLLNFFIGLIKADGICLIVDSCFSGGFKDSVSYPQGFADYTATSFTQEFAEELADQNRVVLMSSQENEVSYGSTFSEFLISGFEGWADQTGNQDGENSAEEAFAFAKPWTELLSGFEQHPTMVDYYPGEFVVTSN